eukprot:GEMP01119610.1.p1 GENE.GEMP01119610.1~~GEMP01119610.1.p1  ORF type:complete len:115 (+),score=4.35 GEMP01119610.1:255-599(+)
MLAIPPRWLSSSAVAFITGTNVSETCVGYMKRRKTHTRADICTRHSEFSASFSGTHLFSAKRRTRYETFTLFTSPFSLTEMYLPFFLNGRISVGGNITPYNNSSSSRMTTHATL